MILCKAGLFESTSEPHGDICQISLSVINFVHALDVIAGTRKMQSVAELA